MIFFNLIFLSLASFKAVSSQQQYITPIGDHVCDGFIYQEAPEITSERIMQTEKTYRSCWSLSNWFKCSSYSTTWVTQIRRTGKATQKIPARVCCEGYKLENGKCWYDAEYHASKKSRIIVISLLAFIPVGLLLAIIIPTFLYVREKRRRIHLEDLEHDPVAFSCNLRGNPLHRGNIYSTGNGLGTAQSQSESLYESVDDYSRTGTARSTNANYDESGSPLSKLDAHTIFLYHKRSMNAAPDSSKGDVLFDDENYDKLMDDRCKTDYDKGTRSLKGAKYNKTEGRYAHIQNTLQVDTHDDASSQSSSRSVDSKCNQKSHNSEC